MGSDQARVTYNETRQYRRVAQQQGRVVLEADTNEAQQIVVEETRRQLLDLVGAHGVPRDPISAKRGAGYRIHKLISKARDFHIDVGSIYVGGWSVLQHDALLTFQKQPDWLDRAPPTVPGAHQAEKEIVYLRLREQEVSAVEDPQLLEPALGGPDTAQRVRLVRRVGRAAAMESPALNRIDWGPGIVLGADQTMLSRTARLSVDFDPSAGGYLGSENQMIRVQGAAPTSSRSGVATQLVWAYDNASSLYRAALPDPKDLATLQLLTTPVDVKHQPKIGQYVEVLLAAVELEPGACVAATFGQLQRITRPYDPQTQTLGLETALPSEYAKATPLFVRIWENSIDVAGASDVGAALVESNGAATGLLVKLQDSTNRTISVAPGDYWSFAVRPSTPNSVYPARYVQPQPPDGPREWACALAVIDWNKERVIDLRPSFANLTSLSGYGGCCKLTLDPSDLRDMSLEEWIESVERKDHPITICLRSGRYLLERPIRLCKEHSHLTIEACGGRVEFLAESPESDDFRQGLLQLCEAQDVTLRGLHFVLPEANFEELITEELFEFSSRAHTVEHEIFWQLRSLRLSVGVLLASCADIAVEDCKFNLPLRLERGDEATAFGACIFATGDIHGLHVSNCDFRAEGTLKNDARHLLFGYLQTPPAGDERELFARAKEDRHEEVLRHLAPEGRSTSLTDASFRRNSFRRLTAAALVMGRLGHLRIAENRVCDCYGGFWHFALDKRRFDWEGVSDFHEILAHVVSDRYFYWPLVLARCLYHPAPIRRKELDHLRFDFQFHDNAVEVSSTAVIGWHAGGGDGGSAILNTNRLTSSMRAPPTGAIVSAHYVSLTGNVLLNRAEGGKGEATAFVISHGAAPCVFAASGNVCEGALRLPTLELQTPPSLGGDETHSDRSPQTRRRK
jgi:hypothetical protein